MQKASGVRSAMVDRKINLLIERKQNYPPLQALRKTEKGGWKNKQVCIITQLMVLVQKIVKNPSVPFKAAATLSGLNEHMLVYLSRMDILTPTGSGPAKRGRQRLYTFADVLFLRVIAALLRKGVEVKRLKDALTRARRETELWIDIRREPNRYLVTDGIDVYVRHKGKLESKSQNGQFAFAFVMDLGP